MRRTLARLLVVLAVATVAAACGAGASASPTADCSHWCGNANASVTFAGRTTTITGGGCYNQGPAGIDVRIGNWREDSAGDYLTLVGYPPGQAAPASAVPTDDTGGGVVASSVSGSIGGTPFVLGDGAVVRFTTATTGSFSGTDVNGYGDASGTFTCS